MIINKKSTFLQEKFENMNSISVNLRELQCKH